MRQKKVICVRYQKEVLQDKMRFIAAKFALTLVVLSLPCLCLISSVSASPLVKIEAVKPPAISLTAYPELIEADGIDQSTIIAIVTDEFGKMVNGTEVRFSTTLGSIDSPKTTVNGITTTILTSSTSPGTAVVEANAIIGAIPTYDTVHVACIETAESGCCNETLWDVTVTVEEAITGTTVSVANTTVTVEGGVISIDTTVENAIKIAGKATAGSVIFIPIENGTLEITLEEDATAVDNVVIGNIRKIRLNTPPEEYITSRPDEVGTASIDLDVDFRETVTIKKLSLEITLREKHEHLPVIDPGKLKDTLAAYFGVDASTIADHSPILVHAEPSGIAPSDITGVPVSITVDKNWYDTVARGNINNVTLFKISADGKIEGANSPEEVIIDSVNDKVTFQRTFDHFCVFAIVARPPTALVPPTPIQPGVVGPIPVRELKPTPIPAPTPPSLIISNVTVTIEEDSVIITWDTNEKSDSQVKSGLKSGQSTIEEYNASNVLFHVIPLKQIPLKNIFENTTYYFIVNSTDTRGNSAQTEEYMFILTPPERERPIMSFILQLPQTLYPHMWWILLVIIILVLISTVLIIPEYKSRRTFDSLIEKPVGTEVLMYLFTTFPKVSRPVDIAKQISVDLNGVLEGLHTLSNKNGFDSLFGIGLVDKVECEGKACYRISKRGKSLMESLK